MQMKSSSVVSLTRAARWYDGLELVQAPHSGLQGVAARNQESTVAPKTSSELSKN
jgi:hypothetical protein